jgi:NADH:ubiquinone oxidoreductase subunit K
MQVNRLARIGGAALSTIILWQTLWGTQVSRMALLLRMVLSAAEAILGLAMVRTHPGATNLT